MGRRAVTLIALATVCALVPHIPYSFGFETTTKAGKPPTVSVKSVMVTETDTGGLFAKVKLKLAHGVGKKVKVWYTTADGTATAPSDYTAASGKVVFKGPAGKQTKTIKIPVHGDDVFEPNETFEVRLTKVKNGRLKSSAGAITVTNDDAVGTRTLSLDFSGAGAGSVAISPTGSTCSGTCTMPVPLGTTVVLTVVPNGSSSFTGWSGQCAGSGSTCTFTMTGDTTAGVGFARLQLNPALTPVFGSRSLSASFFPDPSTVSMSGGGPVNVDYLGGACQGFTTQAPSYRYTYAGGPPTLLRFYFVGNAGTDPIVVVRGPSGTYQCGDDSFGTTNPTIDFNNPAAGAYDVWVGGFTAGSSVPGTLNATKNSTSHP